MTKKKSKYKNQNSRIKTINFSKPKFVKKIEIILPILKKRIGLDSMGLTVLMAIEYCLQEQVHKEFLAFVNSRRRSLLD